MPAAPSVSAARAASIAAPRVTDSPLAAAVPAPSAPLAAIRTAIAAAGESAAGTAAPAPAPASPIAGAAIANRARCSSGVCGLRRTPAGVLVPGTPVSGTAPRRPLSPNVSAIAPDTTPRVSGGVGLACGAGAGGVDLRIRRIVRELVGLPLEADGARHYGILRSVPSGPRSQRSGTVGPAVGPVGTLPRPSFMA